MATVNIQQIQTNNPNYTSGLATQLEVFGISDNYQDNVTFQWYLLDAANSILDASDGVSKQHVICNGSDYQNWYGGNSFPCQYVAQKLGLTII